MDPSDITHMFKITKFIGLCATGKRRACPTRPQTPPPDRDPRSHATRATTFEAHARANNPNGADPPPPTPRRLAAPASGAFPSARTAARTRRSFPP